MKNYTPASPVPRTETILFLSAFARLYDEKRNNEIEARAMAKVISCQNTFAG